MTKRNVTYHTIGAIMAATERDGVMNPRTKHYEFMGPVGTLFMMAGLPGMVVALYVFCNGTSCSLSEWPSPPTLAQLWHPLAFPVVVAWFLFHMLVYLSPLGRTVSGSRLRDSTSLQYKINGLYGYLLAHVIFILGYCVYKVPVSFVYQRYLAFASAAMLFSAILSVYLYVRSFRDGALLALGGNTGNPIYDLFIGRELNPRNGLFDWKVFCEMRPGLIGWVIINYCMLVAQYERNGGTVTNSMVLVCVFQSWYILDALWFEEAILTTMDIVHDGFGFMLAFGDLAWVPFTYSLQARYLVDHPITLPWWAVIGIVLLKVIGYAIFRGSNSQKDTFRRNINDPSVRHLQSIRTRTGSRLIISSWWGICRHPNYVGDLIMALSWSLPCGFGHFLPYFYVTYFTVLLIHRQLRDEAHCREKYGLDWDRYCQIVRWRLVPGLY